MNFICSPLHNETNLDILWEDVGSSARQNYLVQLLRVKRGEYGSSTGMKGRRTGDPRENPLTSGIARQDFHTRKSGSDSTGNQTISCLDRRLTPPLSRRNSIKTHAALPRELDFARLKSIRGIVKVVVRLEKDGRKLTARTTFNSRRGGLPDFRSWESCRTMTLVDGFPRGSPVSASHIPALLHTQLALPSSSPKTLILIRAARISLLISLILKLDSTFQ
ncbi:hypothetical protein PR048_024991 [Dryococelus australis]|uniref:Uncharacterized protein n=1 Tax=Dryococelus australis TaxID=614101 RepID=A0ABQ9GQ67_9NEOP|nr:hypothetical protein PR048_024991 [Dryococelus australis]